MFSIGHTYELEVLSVVEFGAFLDAKNLGEVLLPKKLSPDDLSVGDFVTVFLYQDADSRIVATTEKPKAQVGEFAYLPVTAISKFGAFVDWGLSKDVLVPLAEQHRQMEVGQSYIVYIYLDQIDGRITASSKIDKFLKEESTDFTPQQPVDLIIANSTDLGYKAIINHSHWGVLYNNDVFQRLSFGQHKKGFIKYIRPDGKIDLSLQGGKETRDKYSKIIVNYLNKENGFAAVHDKSDPQLISDVFGMSKKAFKKAIGGLFKQGVIRIEKDGIHLIKNK